MSQSQSRWAAVWPLAIVLSLCTGASALAAAPRSLSLSEAVSLAVARDPVAARHQALAAGYGAEAVAEAQLPDPSLQLGLLNFPTDSFARDQEPMTQVQVGVRQMFPPGETLAVRGRRVSALSTAEEARSRARALEVARATRESWIELQYWLQAESVIQDHRSVFGQLTQITSRQYAAGRHNQQDVVRAELELETLDDRMVDIRRQQDVSRAELEKWIGGAAAGRLVSGVPQLANVRARPALESGLREHPALAVEQALVDAAQHGVALAREAYKPGFSVGVAYGLRDGTDASGAERPDFATATLSMDLPLFRAKRQDQRLAASQRRHAAAALNRDEQYLQLRRMLAVSVSERDRIQQRLHLYRDKIIPQAARSTEASLAAYQNDRTDFTALLRARVTELEVRLRALRLRADLAKVEAQLLYLAGDLQ